MLKVAVLDDYQDVALKMADWSALETRARVTVFRDHLADADEVTRRLRDFNAVIAMRERTPFGRQLLERLPELKLLVTTGMRNPSIDLEAAKDLGIVVCGTRGSGYPPAELAWGLILALVRHIPREDRAIRDGRWQITMGIGLEGKVLGVLGLGRLGSQMAVIGAAFKMAVIAWSQNLTAETAVRFGATLVTKDQLFERSDILSIHLQLSDRTRGLVGAREFGLMKPTAYLINTSRGPIVDEGALVRTLGAGSIAGAGLDVFDEEPLPSDHPFRHLENIVMTPHIGYVTSETYEVYYREAIEDIVAYVHGQPVRVLNPGVLETTQYRRLV